MVGVGGSNPLAPTKLLVDPGLTFKCLQAVFWLRRLAQGLALSRFLYLLVFTSDKTILIKHVAFGRGHH